MPMPGYQTIRRQRQRHRNIRRDYSRSAANQRAKTNPHVLAWRAVLVPSDRRIATGHAVRHGVHHLYGGGLMRRHGDRCGFCSNREKHRHHGSGNLLAGGDPHSHHRTICSGNGRIKCPFAACDGRLDIEIGNAPIRIAPGVGRQSRRTAQGIVPKYMLLLSQWNDVLRRRSQLPPDGIDALGITPPLGAGITCCPEVVDVSGCAWLWLDCSCTFSQAARCSAGIVASAASVQSALCDGIDRSGMTPPLGPGITCVPVAIDACVCGPLAQADKAAAMTAAPARAIALFIENVLHGPDRRRYGGCAPRPRH